MAIEVTKTGRGFHRYGGQVDGSYGERIEIYESSAASGPHVWLNIEGSAHCPQGEGKHLSHSEIWVHENSSITAHLDREQALAIIERLQFWVDEIPERWNTDG